MFLSNIVKDKILAILVFGDPLRNIALTWPIRSPYAAWEPRNGYEKKHNIASFCNKGDLFCDIGALGVDEHLTYGENGE
ncbi:hypothetical protein FRC07_001037 [Ceratobasidium sp. 392]|nr:hypothetical protein FRC07_001037 [Ceratobasidium sp. 392]